MVPLGVMIWAVWSMVVVSACVPDARNGVLIATVEGVGKPTKMVRGVAVNVKSPPSACASCFRFLVVAPFLVCSALLVCSAMGSLLRVRDVIPEALSSHYGKRPGRER